jgi:hypothetical protein
MYKVYVLIDCFFDGDYVNKVLFFEAVNCVTLKKNWKLSAPLAYLSSVLRKYLNVPYILGQNIVTWHPKAAICPSDGRGFAENVPVATRKASLLDGELLEQVSIATITTE